jgi:hypothetical protein
MDANDKLAVQLGAKYAEFSMAILPKIMEDLETKKLPSATKHEIALKCMTDMINASSVDNKPALIATLPSAIASIIKITKLPELNNAEVSDVEINVSFLAKQLTARIETIIETKKMNPKTDLPMIVMQLMYMVGNFSLSGSQKKALVVAIIQDICNKYAVEYSGMVPFLIEVFIDVAEGIYKINIKKCCCR